MHAPTLSVTTPWWLSLPAVSRGLRAVGEVPGRVVVLGVGVSATVSALRRRLLVSPKASSSVSVPGNSSVSQLSISAGFVRCRWSPAAAPAGLHRSWFSALSRAGAIAAKGSHGTVLPGRSVRSGGSVPPTGTSSTPAAVAEPPWLAVSCPRSGWA